MVFPLFSHIRMVSAWYSSGTSNVEDHKCVNMAPTVCRPLVIMPHGTKAHWPMILLNALCLAMNDRRCPKWSKIWMIPNLPKIWCMILIEYILQNLYVILWLDKVITDALRAYLMFFVRFWNCTGLSGHVTWCSDDPWWYLVNSTSQNISKWILWMVAKACTTKRYQTDAWNRKKCYK